MTRHKHANVIIAWAEGKEIQVQNSLDQWINIPNSIEVPAFSDKLKYRVRPIPVVKYNILLQYNKSFILSEGFYKSVQDYSAINGECTRWIPICIVKETETVFEVTS